MGWYKCSISDGSVYNSFKICKSNYLFLAKYYVFYFIFVVHLVWLIFWLGLCYANEIRRKSKANRKRERLSRLRRPTRISSDFALLPESSIHNFNRNSSPRYSRLVIVFHKIQSTVEFVKFIVFWLLAVFFGASQDLGKIFDAAINFDHLEGGPVLNIP